jgi:hypothetical protein
MSPVSRILKNPNINVLWRPTKRQLEFLKAGSIFEVAYLGGAGSGKSTVLLIDACRQMKHKDATAVVFRRTSPELKQLLEYSYKLYRPLGAEFKVQGSYWQFPNGGKIYFSHMEQNKDKWKWNGIEITSGCYFDEITHFEEDMYLYLHSRCRTSNPLLFPRVRCSGSPVGQHINWIRNRFINHGEYNIVEDSESNLKRLYIPATLDDNPYLIANDPNYEARLKIQGNKMYQALRYGDWTQIEGNMFSQVGEHHMIDSYKPSSSDIIIRGFDWGFTAPFASVWLAEDSDKNLIVFKEWIGSSDGSNKGLMMSADQVARTIKQIEETNSISPYYAPSDPAMWGKQNVGDSIGQIFENEGLLMHKANNDRVQGTQQLHMRLNIDEFSQKPKLFITEDCPITFQTLQGISVDKRNPECYDTTGFDHPIDALRYAVMERFLGGDNQSEVDAFGDRSTITQDF